MPSKTAVIRARCEPELKARLLRLLSHPKYRDLELDETKLLRIASKEYCEKHERQLKFKPITTSEIAALIAPAVAVPLRSRKRNPTTGVPISQAIVEAVAHLHEQRPPAADAPKLASAKRSSPSRKRKQGGQRRPLKKGVPKEQGMS